MRGNASTQPRTRVALLRWLQAPAARGRHQRRVPRVHRTARSPRRGCVGVDSITANASIHHSIWYMHRKKTAPNMLQGGAAAAGAAGPPSRVQASAAAAADEVMGVPDAFLGEWITHEQNIVESDGSKLPDVDLALTVRTCMFQPRNKEIARYLPRATCCHSCCARSTPATSTRLSS